MNIDSLDVATGLDAGLAESVAYLREVIGDDGVNPAVRVAAAGHIVACLRQPIPLDIDEDG